MTRVRPIAARFLFALVAFLSTSMGVGVAPAAADNGVPNGGDVNDAVAVNTEDGASIFRLAFSIRTVVDGNVDQQNLALAYASCTDCTTVALAFQVVLVFGDVDGVQPVNQAVAVNDQCAECLTFASATQVVLGFEGRMKFTAEGRKRLKELERRLKELEARLDEMTPAELVTAVAAAKSELLAIIDEELEPVGQQDDASAIGATSTTATTAPTTTSTSAPTTSSSPSTTIADTTTTSSG